jgi:hypothetical protein
MCEKKENEFEIGNVYYTDLILPAVVGQNVRSLQQSATFFLLNRSRIFIETIQASYTAGLNNSVHDFDFNLGVSLIDATGFDMYVPPLELDFTTSLDIISEPSIGFGLSRYNNQVKVGFIASGVSISYNNIEFKTLNLNQFDMRLIVNIRYKKLNQS